ncbi:hypothetical protein OSTOST_19204 [Ostertagia ostertagi]
MPILVGQAQVLNPETQTLESVQVVLDSGADRSFISDNLADRLHLPELDRTVLKICTFGSKTPITKTCGISKVQIWDRQGVPHSYLVGSHEPIGDTRRQNQFAGSSDDHSLGTRTFSRGLFLQRRLTSKLVL